jgi:hypothetical protein
MGICPTLYFMAGVPLRGWCLSSLEGSWPPAHPPAGVQYLTELRISLQRIDSFLSLPEPPLPSHRQRAQASSAAAAAAAPAPAEEAGAAVPATAGQQDAAANGSYAGSRPQPAAAGGRAGTVLQQHADDQLPLGAVVLRGADYEPGAEVRAFDQGPAVAGGQKQEQPKIHVEACAGAARSASQPAAAAAATAAAPAAAADGSQPPEVIVVRQLSGSAASAGQGSALESVSSLGQAQPSTGSGAAGAKQVWLAGCVQPVANAGGLPARGAVTGAMCAWLSIAVACVGEMCQQRCSRSMLGGHAWGQQPSNPKSMPMPFLQAFRLHGIKLDVRPGEMLGICGMTGAGKSCLLGALLGELQPAPGPDGSVAGKALRTAAAGLGTVADGLQMLNERRLRACCCCPRAAALPPAWQAQEQVSLHLQRVYVPV